MHYYASNSWCVQNTMHTAASLCIRCMLHLKQSAYVCIHILAPAANCIHIHTQHCAFQEKYIVLHLKKITIHKKLSAFTTWKKSLKCGHRAPELHLPPSAFFSKHTHTYALYLHTLSACIQQILHSYIDAVENARAHKVMHLTTNASRPIM